MIDIDKNDKKILYEFERNSRQSYATVGKKLKLHKNVVKYKIQKMEKLGIIKNYYTIIDTYKIGYDTVRFYLVYRQITPKIKQEIINYFVNNKNTWWVGSFEGDYDLAIIIRIKNTKDIFIFWEETLKNYHRYFQKQIFSLYEQLFVFRSSYLIENIETNDTGNYSTIGLSTREHIDEMDWNILILLVENSRIPTIEISKTLGINSNTVLSRIRRMQDKKIIMNFSINIDYSKIGYSLYKVNINLINYNKKQEIINYVKQNKHLAMIDKSIGYYDLELEFIVKNLNQFRAIMDDIVSEFPDDINNYKYAHNPIEHKMRYL